MLPGQYRLKQRRDFSRVYKRGSAAAYPAFVLHWRGNQGSCRIGFSVSKKCGNAVERNRVKRRFRHAAYQLIGCFPPGRDYIFVVRRAALDCSYAELEKQIKRALAAAARPQPGRTGRQEKPPGRPEQA